MLWNRLLAIWIRFGDLLGAVTQPVFLGLFYYGVFSPYALALRALGKGGKGMRRRRAPTRQLATAGESLWIPRAEPERKVDFTRQF